MSARNAAAAAPDTGAAGDKPAADGPKSTNTAGMRKFRRTASIVASTLLAGGSASSPQTSARTSARTAAAETKPQTAAAAPAAPSSAQAPAPAETAAAPVQTFTRTRSLAHLKSAGDGVGGSKNAFLNAVTAVKNEEAKKKKKVSIGAKPATATTSTATAVTPDERPAVVRKESKKDKAAAEAGKGTSVPFEWAVVLLAIMFKLGVYAALPLGVMVAGWAFLFMSDIGRKLTGGRLGPMERRILWASASVLMIVLVLKGSSEGEGIVDDETIARLSQQNNILRDVSDASRRENDLLKEKAYAAQNQLDECHASTGMVASKQHDLKQEIDDSKLQLLECHSRLEEFTKFEQLSAEEQYRELLQRQGVLFGQLNNMKSKVMEELDDLEYSLATIDDKKKQVSTWIQTHKGDQDFTKWMEELAPRADELMHVVEDKRDRVAKLNKTLTLPCPFENQSLTMLRHEIDQNRKLQEELSKELESMTKTKNMTLSENYKYILTEEKDTFSELQRAKIDLQEQHVKSSEIRDLLKKKRDRVIQWMQTDQQARNDNDLIAWLKQIEPKYNDVEIEIRDLEDKITRITDTIHLRSKLCDKIQTSDSSNTGGSNNNIDGSSSGSGSGFDINDDGAGGGAAASEGGSSTRRRRTRTTSSTADRDY